MPLEYIMRIEAGVYVEITGLVVDKAYERRSGKVID